MSWWMDVGANCLTWCRVCFRGSVLVSQLFLLYTAELFSGVEYKLCGHADDSTTVKLTTPLRSCWRLHYGYADNSTTVMLTTPLRLCWRLHYGYAEDSTTVMLTTPLRLCWRFHYGYADDSTTVMLTTPLWLLLCHILWQSSMQLQNHRTMILTGLVNGVTFGEFTKMRVRLRPWSSSSSSCTIPPESTLLALDGTVLKKSDVFVILCMTFDAMMTFEVQLLCFQSCSWVWKSWQLFHDRSHLLRSLCPAGLRVLFKQCGAQLPIHTLNYWTNLSGDIDF